MFSRLTILLFVFFALAGLLRVATPDAQRVTKAGSDEAASAPIETGLTIDRILTGDTGHQP